MRKNYYLAVLLSVLMLLPSLAMAADVTSITDLYGTYKFTATVEVTDAGQAKASKFVTEAETVITKDASGNYSAQIENFAGFAGSEYMKASSYDATNKQFKVVNPNGGSYGVVGDNLYMADAAGNDPFDRDNGFANLIFTVDPSTKTITVPDFTVGSYTGTYTVYARYSNVKFTFVAGESVDIPSISGEWTVTAGTGEYSSKPGSTLPTSYKMTLTGSDTDAKAYKAEIAIEGYQTFTLDATFDGVSLSVGFDNFIVPGTTDVYLINWGNSLKGDFSFSYVNETTMTIDHQLQLGVANPDGGTESPYTFLQWWMDGSAKKAGEAAESFSWAGTYTLHSGNYSSFNVANTYANDGEVVIEENNGAYYVTKFLGVDVTSLNMGGFKVTPGADGTTATMALNGGYGSALLSFNWDSSGSTGHVVVDANGACTSLALTYDATTKTVTLADFFIVNGKLNNSFALDTAETPEYYVMYMQNTLTKAAEDEPVNVEWGGTYTLHADNFNVFDSTHGLTNDIQMVIEQNASTGNYYVTSIMGKDLGSFNYGGLRLTLSDDNLSAQISLSGGYGSALVSSTDYTNYLAIVDSKGTTNSLTMTYDAASDKFKLDDFYVVYGPLDSTWAIDMTKATYVGMYGNNTLSKTTTGIADVPVENAKVIAADGAVILPEAQQVMVFDINGRILFNGVTDRVEGLAKGLYIVKTANGAVKVAL